MAKDTGILLLLLLLLLIPSVSRIPRDFGKKIDTKEKIVGVTIIPIPELLLSEGHKSLE